MSSCWLCDAVSLPKNDNFVEKTYNGTVTVFLAP